MSRTERSQNAYFLGMPRYSFTDLRSVELLSFFKETYFLGGYTYEASNVPDLSKKTIMITGGNSGLGKITAKVLLEHGANVYIACRNAEKAQEAIDDLKSVTGKEAHFLKLDLSDLKSVKAAAEEFVSKETTLHVLYNNAGTMMNPMEEFSNGYDLQFHANIMGHFYLTKLLLPLLESTAKESAPGDVRVLYYSSTAHYLARAEPINFETLTDTPTRWKYTTDDMYFQSKFAANVLAKESSRRHADSGVIFHSMNPGSCKGTPISRNLTGFSVPKTMLKIVQIYSPDLGWITPVWGGIMPEAGKRNGEYIMPWGKFGTPRPETHDENLGEKLWTWLEEQTAKI